MRYSSASSTSDLVGEMPLAFSSFFNFHSHPFCKEVISVTRSKGFFQFHKKFLSQVS